MAKISNARTGSFTIFTKNFSMFDRVLNYVSVDDLHEKQ